MMFASVVPDESDDRFVRLVLPELDVLLRVARRIVTRPADAEDLVQDTLVRAFRSVDTFDGAHPRAWLLTIMRNVNVNQHRRRRPGLLDADQMTIEVADPAADDPFDDVFDEAIETALARLGPRHRAVVDLVDIAGLSYAEAAIALGIPVGTIMSRLSRARQQIRDELRVPTGSTPKGGDR